MSASRITSYLLTLSWAQEDRRPSKVLLIATGAAPYYNTHKIKNLTVLGHKLSSEYAGKPIPPIVALILRPKKGPAPWRSYTHWATGQSDLW